MYAAAMTQDLNTTSKAPQLKAELLPRSAYSVSYTPDRMVAGFAFEIQTGLHSFASDRVSPFVTPPSTLAFTPAGCDVFSQSDSGGEYLTVSADTSAIKHLFEQSDWSSRRYNNVAGGEAINLAQKLRNMLLFEPDDDMGIEETSLQLFEQAAFRDIQKCGKPASSMTPRRVRQFHELLEEDLSASLSLESIATALGLSSSFFIRAFKAATGGTPHAYILQRRLGEARKLLATSKEPIAVIAADTGFANQAHMTTVFKKHLGVTPKQYRQIRH